MTNEELLQAISSVMQTQFQAMRTEFRTELRSAMEELRKEMHLMEADFNGQIQHLSDQIQQLSNQVQQINITLETDIMPRLQNIENCYLSTYQKYAKRADQIDCMQADIDTLKPIVQEHSAMLQRLA